MTEVDLLIKNCAELLTLTNEGPKRGADLDRLDLIENGAVAIEGDRIKEVGDTIALTERYPDAREKLDATGRVVMPGFVDPHTHPVFGATREQEFDWRIRGKTYMEITEQGGGIFSSVRTLRQTPTDELIRLLKERCDKFISLGTTTAEAKSGYGLNRDDEIRALEIIGRLNGEHPIDLIPTFLGAHQMPREFADNRQEYIRILTEEIMPEIKGRGLAEFCDIFTEEGVYEIEESRRIMSAAKRHGFKLRFHADELASIGGAELAAELGAHSADHLVMASDAGIAAMRDAGVIPVILPATVFSLNLSQKPRSRKMIEDGLPVALATDFNPGTSFTQSMPEVINLACCMLRFTVAEAINAAIVNSAWSLDRGDRIGSLEKGKQADLIILDCKSHLFLGYRLGWNPVEKVIKKGRLVYERPELKVG
ncbi:MAG: imidazolonepropionase [Planctomycetota bacterium]|jgi:imidazolonepropionase